MLGENKLMYDIHLCYNVILIILCTARSSLSRMSALGVDGGD